MNEYTELFVNAKNTLKYNLILSQAECHNYLALVHMN